MKYLHSDLYDTSIFFPSFLNDSFARYSTKSSYVQYKQHVYINKVNNLLGYYAKGKGSLTSWNDKGKIDVSSEGTSSRVSNSRRRAFARNVDFSFVVSGNERTFTFRVSLNTLPTLETLVRDITGLLAYYSLTLYPRFKPENRVSISMIHSQ